jgi:hypothetical protein
MTNKESKRFLIFCSEYSNCQIGSLSFELYPDKKGSGILEWTGQSHNLKTVGSIPLFLATHSIVYETDILRKCVKRVNLWCHEVHKINYYANVVRF